MVVRISYPKWQKRYKIPMILGFICGGKGFVSGRQDQYILGIISPNLPGKETCVKKAGLGGGWNQ